MKKMKLTAAALLLVLALLILPACQPGKTPDESNHDPTSFQTQPSENVTLPPPTIPETEPESDTVTIEDMSGRKVEIPSPAKLMKVYYPSPLAQLMIYTINPERMAGLVSELSEEQLKYMPLAKGLKVFGNFDGGKAINPEEVLASGSQVFISMGPMKIDETTKEKADELQNKLGIPVLVVNGLFPKRAEAYRFLGKVFGEEERCEKMAQYCEATLKDVEEKVASIEEDKRVTLYYAEKPNGLATEPEMSSHAAVFRYAGAKNVAAVELTPGSGMTPVSLEQVIAWNPEVIFMGSGGNSPYKEITTNENWANIKAVKDGRVYEAPRLPFSWIDRPPSSQQYLGLRYVANILYPEVFNYDMEKEVQEFFSLFYQLPLTEEDVRALLGA